MTEAEKLAQTCVAEARNWMVTHVGTIKHCLRQLDEQQVWWRPNDSMNSIGNLLLHLCGNISQRILATVGGEPDRRDRPSEFAQRSPIPKDELVRRLDDVTGMADEVLAGLRAEQLLEPRRYQGQTRVFDGTVLSTVFHSLTHLCGHAQEIVYITRLQLGKTYQFQALPPPGENGPD